jgi:type IV secretory pathway TrbF-like protein
MATTIDPNSRQAFARMVGLGKGLLWGQQLAIILLAGTTAVGGYLAYREAKIGGDRVQRYVVYLDRANAPVSTSAVSQEWHPDQGVYLDFAARWIRYLRGRPRDNSWLLWQRMQVIYATDQKAWNPLRKLTTEADNAYKNAAVDIDDVSANLVEMPSADLATVLVRWRETPQRGGSRPTNWTATLTIANRPPSDPITIKQNPLGLFVMSAQISRIETAPAAPVAPPPSSEPAAPTPPESPAP